MLGRHALGHANGRTNDQRHTRLSAGHIADLRGLVDDLVHADRHEIRVHDLGDCRASGHRDAERNADDGCLGDRRLEDARAETLAHSQVDAEGAAAGQQVFADDDHSRLPLHFFRERLADGVPECDLAHSCLHHA